MADHPVTEPEEWRPVPGHPGYEASSLGRVRSVDRWITSRRFWPSVMLRPFAGDEYKKVRLGPKLFAPVHIIVCLTFHGVRPSKSHLVAHWNGDKLDNRSSNLRWATPKENKADEVRHGTWTAASRHGSAKLTETDVLVIRKLRQDHRLTFHAIGKRFGITRSHVKGIVDGRWWKSVS